uniref:Uncharacterized protein n=1 Tax=Globodera rostochiensis TaxID=31243 RepID=A0A914HI08_GLORO
MIGTDSSPPPVNGCVRLTPFVPSLTVLRMRREGTMEESMAMAPSVQSAAVHRPPMPSKPSAENVHR